MEGSVRYHHVRYWHKADIGLSSSLKIARWLYSIAGSNRKTAI